MQKPQELIERFFANRCTKEEADRVIEYLENNPAILHEYLNRTWNEPVDKALMPATYRDEMLNTILSATEHKKNNYLKRRNRWMAVAASLVLFLGISWLLSESRTQGAMNRVASVDVGYPVPIQWTIKENTGPSSMKIELTDGSEVTLSPKSTVRYQEFFAADKRDIYLEGAGLFVVAKDKAKPFTVHSGQFSTTALGTIFRVTNKDDNYNVKLYEGKVVIKGWSKNIFLEPGQQMVYNKQTSTLAQTSFKQNEIIIRKKTAGLVFHDAPLNEVMDQLKKEFKIDIDYNKTEIEDKYFSGSVLPNDSLITILKVIAQMNALTVTQKTDGFIVRKSQ